MNHNRQSSRAQLLAYFLRIMVVGFVMTMSTAAVAQVADSDTPAIPPADSDARNKAVVVGTAIIAVIAVAGLIMICLVAVWGRRIRKVIRQPLPNQSRGDELWYLKPKKQVAVESSEDFDDGDTAPE